MKTEINQEEKQHKLLTNYKTTDLTIKSCCLLLITILLCTKKDV